MLRWNVLLLQAFVLSPMVTLATEPFNLVSQVAHQANCDCGDPVCGCEPDCGCEPGCDCEPACGCESCSATEPECGCEAVCDGGCDSLGGGSCLSGCCLGGGGGDDPFSLFSCLPCGLTAGGWAQIGYHSKGSPSRFNSRPDEVQLHQGWLYLEKGIDTSDGFDIGGRLDYVYGTDSQDTQAFGIGNDHWDNDFDHGNDYGHAIPQAYVEMGYGDLTVKAGHFYTIIGWEVVTAPDNFFYSHAYTMYNSEPFTHTGALASLAVGDDTSIFGGYTLGWDSGFEDNGDNFIGGLSTALTDCVTFTYATVFGRFVEETLERGYMHSVVFDVAVTEKLQYIFQSDWLDTEDNVGTAVRESIGINQYMLYNINDSLAVGGRFEWWNVLDDNTGEKADVYNLTLGCNVKPHSNVIIRPEVRWDWDSDRFGVNENGKSSQTTFGIDSIFMF